MQLCRLSAAVLGIAAALGVRAGEVSAQSQTGERVQIPHTTYIGLNPAGVLWNFGSVELESGVAQGITLGLSGAYTDLDRVIHTSADVKLRYYPMEVVLRGFSVGLSGGYLRYSSEQGAPPERRKIDAATIGVLGDYNFMIGQSKRFVLGTGVGAKRVLAGGAKRDSVDLGPVYVTARFIVGLAF